MVIDNPDIPEVSKTPYYKTGATAPDSPVAIITIVGAALVGAGAAALGFTRMRREDPKEDAEFPEEVNE